MQRKDLFPNFLGFCRILCCSAGQKACFCLAEPPAFARGASANLEFLRKKFGLIMEIFGAPVSKDRDKNSD